MIVREHVFCHWISAHSPILPLWVVLTLDVIYPRGLSEGCGWWWCSGDGGGHLGQSRALHAFLEWIVIVNGKVSLAWLVVVDTVEALDRAVTHDPTVLLLVGALVGMFLGSVVGEATDMAADVFGWVSAFLHHVREDVAVGTLLEGDKFACEAHS
jgi:hypothetical protein